MNKLAGVCSDCLVGFSDNDPVYVMEEGEYVCEDCWNIWSHPNVFLPLWMRSHLSYYAEVRN